jgi:hypothetical protein
MRKNTVKKVHKYLQKCAHNQMTTTYSVLMELFDLTTREIRPILQEIVEQDGTHELVSIVRSKQTNRPSTGYFDSLTKSSEADYKKMTKKAFKRWS